MPIPPCAFQFACHLHRPRSHLQSPCHSEIFQMLNLDFPGNRSTWGKVFSEFCILHLLWGGCTMKWVLILMVCLIWGTKTRRILNPDIANWNWLNQINQGDQLGSISGVLDPFGGLWMAPKPIVLLWVYRVRRILGHISTFPDLPFQPSEIFMVQHGLYRFSAYSTYMFIFWGYLGPLESVSALFLPFRAIFW